MGKILLVIFQVTFSLLLFSNHCLAKDFEKLPKGNPPYPTLILLHDIWGLDNFMKREAERYADLGFYVYAIDLYNGVVPADAPSAARQRDKVARDDLLVKTKKTIDRLLKNKKVDKLRLGILGWGMGGGIALRAAIQNPDLRTIVMNYGDPVMEVSELKKIRAKGLALFAEKDPHTSAGNIAGFKKALEEARLTFDVKTLTNATYGFFDYTRTENFNPKASEEGKTFIAAFLKRHLALTEYVK